MFAVHSISSKFNFFAPTFSHPLSQYQELQNLIEDPRQENIQPLLGNLPFDTINYPLPNGELPLHYAVRQGSIKVVEWILSLRTCDLSQKDDQGLTALDHAFIGSDKEIRQLLIGRCFAEKLAWFKFDQKWVSQNDQEPAYI